MFENLSLQNIQARNYIKKENIQAWIKMVL